MVFFFFINIGIRAVLINSTLLIINNYISFPIIFFLFLKQHILQSKLGHHG